MPSRYKVAKGDMFLQSKHADSSYTVENGFTLFFYNTPKKGKALVVDYMPNNYPAVYVYTTANWKARLDEKYAVRNPHAIKKTF